MTSKVYKSGYSYDGYQEESTNSASLAQAQRRIKQLETENKELKEEISELKSTYIQLTKESSKERFDERRVTFLKSQLLQLERQIVLLNEALGSRIAVLVEAENSLGTISECCKGLLEGEGRIGEMYVSKEDLKHIVSTAESARIKLFKNIENTSMQRLHKPLQFMETFIKSSSQSEVTLLDVCTAGIMEHINLKQVAKLESKLFQVYKQLQGVNQCLDLQVYPEGFKELETVKSQQHTNNTTSGTVPQVPRANFVKLYGESSRACHLLSELLPELLELSVLIPAAPLPVLKKCIVRELTVDNVMAKLPVLPKSKSQETRDVIEALLKVFSLIQLKANTQEKIYKEELKFHKSVYQLQLDYIDNLFKSIRFGYKSFEDDAYNLVCKPLKEVLRIYETLQITASEEALRQFLKVFKEYHIQISDAVEKLETKEKGEGPLSVFGEEFFEKLQKLECECQDNRDDNVQKLQDVKEQQEDYWAEIKRTFHVDETELENNKNIQNSGRKPKPKHSRISDSMTSDKYHSDNEPVTTTYYQFQYEKEPLPVIKTPDSSRSRTSPKRRSSRERDKNHSDNSVDSNRYYNDSVNSARKSDPQKESEDLFKSTLRGGYDDGGFVFDSPRTGTPSNRDSPDVSLNGKTHSGISYTDDSECTCGADHHDHIQSSPSRTNNRNNSADNNTPKKPPLGGVSYSNSPKKTSGKLMKGVPRSKLLLKSKTRSFDDNASDSEHDSSVYSSGRPLSRSGSVTRVDNRVAKDKMEANFPVTNASIKRRSGSLPRNKPAVSHWK